MYEKIPYINDSVKAEYASFLSEKLGSESKFKLSPATITSGIIASPKDTKVRLIDPFDRVYILGIPKTEERPEQRGIGIMIGSTKTAAIYDLINYGGFLPLTPGHPRVFKSLDTTEELIYEIRKLEKIVLSK